MLEESEIKYISEMGNMKRRRIKELERERGRKSATGLLESKDGFRPNE